MWETLVPLIHQIHIYYDTCVIAVKNRKKLDAYEVSVAVGAAFEVEVGLWISKTDATNEELNQSGNLPLCMDCFTTRTSPTQIIEIHVFDFAGVTFQCQCWHAAFVSGISSNFSGYEFFRKKIGTSVHSILEHVKMFSQRKTEGRLINKLGWSNKRPPFGPLNCKLRQNFVSASFGKYIRFFEHRKLLEHKRLTWYGGADILQEASEKQRLASNLQSSSRSRITLIRPIGEAIISKKTSRIGILLNFGLEDTGEIKISFFLANNIAISQN